jgi:hypothetical protein
VDAKDFAALIALSKNTHETKEYTELIGAACMCGDFQIRKSRSQF